MQEVPSSVMSTEQSSWSATEIKQVLAIAAAPALVVLLWCVVLSAIWSQDMTLLGLFALPVAYGTLFLCVMPALAILRRRGRENGPTFVAVCAATSCTPWFLAYLVGGIGDIPPPNSLEVTAALSQIAVTAVVAAVIWRSLFHTRHVV